MSLSLPYGSQELGSYTILHQDLTWHLRSALEWEWGWELISFSFAPSMCMSIRVSWAPARTVFFFLLPPCPLHPPSAPCPLQRAGPQARQVFNFPRRQTIPLLGPVPALLASWPCSSSFPFEITRCPVPSSPAQRPLGFQLQPRGQSLIQLEWEGFLHFFLSYSLFPSFPLFTSSFLF